MGLLSVTLGCYKSIFRWSLLLVGDSLLWLIYNSTHICYIFVSMRCFRYLVQRHVEKWSQVENQVVSFNVCSKWPQSRLMICAPLLLPLHLLVDRMLLRFFFYCRNRTLALLLVPRPVAMVIIIPLKSFLTVFCESCFRLTWQAYCNFRLGFGLESFHPHWSDSGGSGWVFGCLWSDFCLTFTTGTPHRADIKSNKFLFFLFFLFVTLTVNLLPIF